MAHKRAPANIEINNSLSVLHFLRTKTFCMNCLCGPVNRREPTVRDARDSDLTHQSARAVRTSLTRLKHACNAHVRFNDDAFDLLLKRKK